MPMKSREAIEELKNSWRFDPVWEIETTDGFEDHYDELKAYSIEQRKIWAADAQRRRENESPFVVLNHAVLTSTYYVRKDHISYVRTLDASDDFYGHPVLKVTFMDGIEIRFKDDEDAAPLRRLFGIPPFAERAEAAHHRLTEKS